MDPQQAALQAQAIHDELVRLVPDAAKEFDANLEALKKDLADLDAAVGRRLRAARQGTAAGFASRVPIRRAPLRLEFAGRALGAR